MDESHDDDGVDDYKDDGDDDDDDDGKPCRDPEIPVTREGSDGPRFISKEIFCGRPDPNYPLSPQSREDPHGRTDKLHEEKSSSEVGRHVE